MIAFEWRRRLVLHALETCRCLLKASKRWCVAVDGNLLPEASEEAPRSFFLAVRLAEASVSKIPAKLVSPETILFLAKISALADEDPFSGVRTILNQDIDVLRERAVALTRFHSSLFFEADASSPTFLAHNKPDLDVFFGFLTLGGEFDSDEHPSLPTLFGEDGAAAAFDRWAAFHRLSSHEILEILSEGAHP